MGNLIIACFALPEHSSVIAFVIFPVVNRGATHLIHVDHPTDDLLEGYSRNSLSEPARNEIEEHLLLCESCRGRLDHHEQYIRAMRAALRDIGTRQT